MKLNKTIILFIVLFFIITGIIFYQFIFVNNEKNENEETPNVIIDNNVTIDELIHMYLFSFDIEYEKNLTKGPLNNIIIVIFAKNKVYLSNNSEIVATYRDTTNGDKFIFKYDIIDGQKCYVIENDGSRLNVYDRNNSTWLNKKIKVEGKLILYPRSMIITWPEEVKSLYILSDNNNHILIYSPENISFETYRDMDVEIVGYWRDIIVEYPNGTCPYPWNYLEILEIHLKK